MPMAIIGYIEIKLYTKKVHNCMKYITLCKWLLDIKLYKSEILNMSFVMKPKKVSCTTPIGVALNYFENSCFILKKGYLSFRLEDKNDDINV